ncbi:MAG: peroxiredoxin family protein [Methanobacteriota archaeon]
MTVRKCPVCGVAVKIENLERHIRDQHPRASVDVSDVLSAEEREAARRARTAVRPAVSRTGIGIVSAVAVGLSVLLVVLAFNPFPNVGPNVGQVAPDFFLPTTDGGNVRLSSFLGTPVLLEFMDVDCSFCQTEARDVLSSVHENYSALVRFLSVDANLIGSQDTDARVNAFRTQYGTPWTYAMDPTGATVRTYGIRSTPTTFILGRDGVITRVFVGVAPSGTASYAQALDAALGA